ncbi:Translocation protein S62 [Malassezia vespertilionis]|uniref:Translocation protein SEC62 n=1 Tax=Malassezia vespertilionis TaxID=2020962 RepID=A0A2N1JBI5_9BASI|nr:Translocation protein S62 [Malassezia vespertilionis]PKI83908.1 Sec62p [Malassezia vespertilionis]WFD06754.1 Translocation protein S62 [Malassezia vespertilionis]
MVRAQIAKAGMKTRSGIVNGQRAEYFKGTAAVKALLSPAYAKLKNAPKITTEEEAEQMLHKLLPFAFFLRVERGESANVKTAPRPLQVNQVQIFQPDMYYVWFYEGSQLVVKLAGLGMVILMLAAVMFPLWPTFLRRGVWYLSVALLGLFALLMIIALIRLIIWAVTIAVLPPGIWIFPNLFADVGVIESFIPLWSWDVVPEKIKIKKAKKAKKVKKAESGEQEMVGATIEEISDETATRDTFADLN